MIELNLGILGTWQILDLSLLIFIIGIITYYFGKLISEAKPLKEKKEVNYSEGLFFLILFVLFPLLLYNAIIKQEWQLNWTGGILLLVQYGIMQLFHNKKTAQDISKVEKEGLYKRAYDKKIENLKVTLKWFGKQEEKISRTKEWFSKWIFRDFGKNTLYILSLINLISFIILLNQNIAFLYKGFSALIFFLSLSYSAIFYSCINSKPFNAILHLENNKELKGKILKIEDEFINILSDNKIFHVYSNKIMSIERISIPDNQVIEKVLNKK